MSPTDDKDFSGKIFDKEILANLLTHARPYRKILLTLVFITFLGGIIAPVRPLLVKHTLDHYVMLKNHTGLMLMALIMVGILVFQAFLDYVNSYYSAFVGQKIIFDLRTKLYQHLLNFKLTYFDNTPVGRLITRNVSDIETISDIFTEGLADIAGSVLQIAFFVGVMMYLNVKLAFISLSVVPLLLISTYIFKEKIKKSFNEVRSAVAKLNAFVQEHLTGMSIVQIFNAEKKEYEKFTAINKEHLNANLKSVLYYSVYYPVAEVLSAIGIGLLVWWGGMGVIEREVTLGTLVSFIMLIQMLFRPIREIADKYNTLQMGIVGSARVLNLLNDYTHIPKQGNQQPPAFIPEITFKNVWFAYKEPNYVLKNISFSVKKGQSVAIVGATGAGKSSIINLINRFYDIQKGEITIGNLPIQNYDIGYLRSKIGLVLQDVFLFSDSVLQNIHLGKKEVSESHIYQASNAIGATEFIRKLPNGFHHQVMERGATLSAGQRQMVAFIRAMIYNPDILILDEATSSLDTETEIAIQNALSKLLIGRTSIIIAHRLSTIQNADYVIVMDKGEVAEYGTHKELMDKNGKYAALIKAQAEAQWSEYLQPLT